MIESVVTVSELYRDNSVLLENINAVSEAITFFRKCMGSNRHAKYVKENDFV